MGSWVTFQRTSREAGWWGHRPRGSFLGLSVKEDLDTPQLWRAQGLWEGLRNYVAPSFPSSPLLSKSWCASGVLL